MNEMNTGYKYSFLGKGHSLKLPVLSSKQKQDLVLSGNKKHILDYIHYSVVMSRKRRFAYFTAVNIDGSKWCDNPRKGNWNKDKRIDKREQYGRELYGAAMSNFEQGHLVRREDPEWGDNITATDAGKNTFWYPNCVPQHKDLNKAIWAELENNILHKGAIGNQMKISVFTGPVLSDNDGVFVTRVEDQEVKIPGLFWKIVTWVKEDGKAYAVGFVQSQEKFLIKDRIIKKLFVPDSLRLSQLRDDDIFEHLKFKDGKTYQVRIEEIETLTGLKFDWPDVIKPYQDSNPKLIGIEELDKSVEPDKLNLHISRRMKLNLKDLVLG
jgi:endonuclease G, mitochondrial